MREKTGTIREAADVVFGLDTDVVSDAVGEVFFRPAGEVLSGPGGGDLSGPQARYCPGLAAGICPARRRGIVRAWRRGFVRLLASLRWEAVIGRHSASAHSASIQAERPDPPSVRRLLPTVNQPDPNSYPTFYSSPPPIGAFDRPIQPSIRRRRPTKHSIGRSHLLFVASARSSIR